MNTKMVFASDWTGKGKEKKWDSHIDSLACFLFRPTDVGFFFFFLFFFEEKNLYRQGREQEISCFRMCVYGGGALHVCTRVHAGLSEVFFFLPHPMALPVQF